MTGIVYPNIVGTLAPLIQMEQQDKRLAFEEARAKRQDEADARDREAEQYVPAALGGDKEALAKVAGKSPKTAFALAPLLERADTNQRARVKEAAAWTSQAALGVLGVPPEQRPAAYAAALEDGRARGYDLSKLPQQYTPDVEGRLNFYVSQARDVNKYFEEQGNRPQPVGGAPGAPAAPAGTGNPASAIAGIESGGKYDAVGPVANAQGNRAYGKYQVLDSNIGPWTQEVLGKPMTPQEFLANPQAQDQVFNAKFGQYVKQYGSPEAASRAWFAGPGGMNNPGARDVNGMTVAQYGQRFNQGMGGPQAPQGDATQPQPQPQADANGTPLPPKGDGLDQFRAMQLPPGARFMAVKGQPIVKDGAAYIMQADGSTTWVPLPQRADPSKPPEGYEPNPAGGGLRPIAGGPQDPAQAGKLAEAKRAANEKAIPQTVTKGMQENLNSLKQLDRVTALLDQTPDSVGGPGSVLAANIPGAGWVQNRMDREGTQLRALIADVGSLKIHDRSGAAVTASEFPRLRPFIPSISDDATTVRQKLANFRAELDAHMRDVASYYGPENGFKAYTPVSDYLEGKGTGQPGAPAGGAPQAGSMQMPRLSPEDAAKLAPGTSFIGQDGIPRVRR